MRAAARASGLNVVGAVDVVAGADDSVVAAGPDESVVTVVSAPPSAVPDPPLLDGATTVIGAPESLVSVVPAAPVGALEPSDPPDTVTVWVSVTGASPPAEQLATVPITVSAAATATSPRLARDLRIAPP
jgi:hypothetical protein